jgi:L-proline amide hydrolase
VRRRPSAYPSERAREREALVRLRAGLPEKVQAALRKHEATGTTKSKEYKAAMMVFWAKHGCGVQPFPPEFLHSISLPNEDSTVLDAM